jgi:hypothetical protein
MTFEGQRCWLTGILNVLVLNAVRNLSSGRIVLGALWAKLVERIEPLSLEAYAGTSRVVASWSCGRQRKYMKEWPVALVNGSLLTQRVYNALATKTSSPRDSSHVSQHASIRVHWTMVPEQNNDPTASLRKQIESKR